MIQVCDCVQDDSKSRKELLENVEVCKTTYKDAADIIRILSNCFGIEDEYMALMQLLETRANLNESVKVIDKRDGKIYGFLIFTEAKIQQGTPLMFMKNRDLLNEFTRHKSQINGHSFILDSRLRGTGVDKKMLYYNLDFLKQYDFIWCGVERSLKSHNYWKKLGFFELFSIEEASFYVMPFDKKEMLTIFMINDLLNKYEENNSFRKNRKEAFRIAS